MASLFVIDGRDQGKRFELDAPVVALGRDRTNPIQFHDSEVSRRHAQVCKTDAGFEVVDLDSSNGTFVNSRPVRSQKLQNGDRLQVGRTLMIFTCDDDRSSFDVAAEVDIVSPQAAVEGSRIVTTVSRDESSEMFEMEAAAESPWLARARSNLQIMYRTALAVSHTLDIDQLLGRIMGLIFEWVEADRGCIMLLNRDTQELEPKVFRHREGEKHGEEKLLISQTILDYVMEHQEGVLTSDAKDDERWDPAASILKVGVREAICVPMQGRYGVVGVIYIDTFTSPGRMLQNRQVNRFSDEHLKLMVAIGHQAALAVEDTAYYSAMVQAERLAAMGQTIATLSHHIKNILQGIRGGSYLIEEGLKVGDSEVVRRGWNIVDKNQDKISNLVMDMLTFSKEREPEMVSASLNDVAHDVVELMQARAADAQVQLRWLPGSHLPDITFDPDAMHRAILNVVTNAIDACKEVEGGSVTVSTEYSRRERLARIMVEDNGEGIAPDDIKRIFSVFESRKGSRGTGLGLPVSQKILREHGGDVRVESTPGVGSKFILEFPSAPNDSSGGSETITEHMPSERA